MNEKQTWNNIADIYNDKFMSMDYYNVSYDQFCSLLTQNGHILELGCGPGIITKYVHDKRPDLRILAADYAPSMIELAKKNVPAAEFQVLDARQIKDVQNTYDGIIAGFILPYLTKEEVVFFFQTCYDFLLTGSPFYLSFVPGKEADSHLKKGSDGSELFFRYFEHDFIINLLTNCGFKLIQKFEISYPIKEDETEIHVAIIVQKI